MNAISAWLYALMVYLAPPDKLAAAPQLQGWEETAEDKHARYKEIAEALYHVTYDEGRRPLFGGSRGRARTAATLLAIAFMESGFAKDVDKGPCSTKRPPGMDCDGGQAAGLGQIRLVDGLTILPIHGVEGKTQKDVFADRELMFSIELFMVARSFASCRKYGADWALNVYASGSCTRSKKPNKISGEGLLAGQLVHEPDGLAAGRVRLVLARRLLSRTDVPGPDKDYLVGHRPVPEAARPGGMATEAAAFVSRP
jgi:hypothetical protein